MANVRQSTVGQFDICGQRVAFDRDPTIRYGSGINRALGTAVHAGLEVYYSARMNGEAGLTVPNYVEAAVASLDDEVAKTGDGFSWQYQHETKTKKQVVLTRAESVKMISKVIVDYHEQEWFWPLDYEILAVELQFLLPIPGKGHTATGTFDLALRGPDGWVWGADHKTGKDKKPKAGKFSAASSVQAAVYSWAIAQLFDFERVAFAFDYLSFMGGFTRVIETRTQAQIDVSLDKVNIVGDILDADGPYLPNPSHFLCSQHFCDHWDYCPYGRVLNQ